MFTGKDLNNHKTKVKAGRSYTLVCLCCKNREDGLVKKLEILDARICRRSCGSSTFYHKETCKATFNVRLSEQDLEFLHFRPGHKDKFRVNDVAYYRRFGVLT
jgi:hypothetical protein